MSDDIWAYVPPRTIHTSWARTVEPQIEPLTLADAKAHAVISQDDDDASVTAYITAARIAAENYLQRALCEQTWQYTQSDFTNVMWLPMAAPLQSVTAITYYAADGTLTTLAPTVYDVDTTSEPGRVTLAASQSWPTVQADRKGPRVFVTYVAGATSAAGVPELVKQGMRVFVAQLDADRLGESPTAFRAAYALWDLVGRVSWREPHDRYL